MMRSIYCIPESKAPVSQLVNAKVNTVVTVKKYSHQTKLQGFVGPKPHCGDALCIKFNAQNN